MASLSSKQVLFLTKPLDPPWSDGTKCVVRDISQNLRRFSPLIPVAQHSALLGNIRLPSSDRARWVSGLTSLLFSRRRTLAGVHAAFTPTLSNVLWLRGLRNMGVPMVQHITSLPPSGIQSWMIVGDEIITVSSDAAYRVRQVSSAKVTTVLPSVDLPPMPSDSERRALRNHFALTDAPVLLFPGDWEFGEGLARFMSLAVRHPDYQYVFSCRAKTETSKGIERTTLNTLRHLGISARSLGTTSHLKQWLLVSDAIVFLSDTLTAKLDLPLVLLEAMALGRPVFVSATSPAAELARYGGAVALDFENAGDAVSEILNNPPHGVALGEEARRTCLEHHTHQRVVSDVEEIYLRVFRS